jgi:hypothetical protein
MRISINVLLGQRLVDQEAKIFNTWAYYISVFMMLDVYILLGSYWIFCLHQSTSSIFYLEL